MSSNQDEFGDYLASLAKAEAQEAAHQESILRHQLWQETTILGRLTSLIQSFSKHPFFQAVTDAFRDQQQGQSLNAIILYNAVRIGLIFMAILTVFIIGKLIQKLIGDEIIIEQVIEIVEEIPKSKAQKKNRRGAKEKTSKEE